MSNDCKSDTVKQDKCFTLVTGEGEHLDDTFDHELPRVVVTDNEDVVDPANRAAFHAQCHFYVIALERPDDVLDFISKSSGITDLNYKPCTCSRKMTFIADLLSPDSQSHFAIILNGEEMERDIRRLFLSPFFHRVFNVIVLVRLREGGGERFLAYSHHPDPLLHHEIVVLDLWNGTHFVLMSQVNSWKLLSTHAVKRTLKS